MRAVMLGAGASVCAGYPSAEALLETLREDAEEAGSSQLREAWKRWKEVIRDAPSEIRHLLTAKNPEIVISLLDLCQEYVRENFEIIFPGDRGRQAADQSLSHDRLDAAMFSNAGHAWIDNAVGVKSLLILLLGEYFMWRHAQDAEDSKRRSYLKDLLSGLKAGDVIITLNWDTTVERTLLEQGRWSPADGYGFAKRFRSAEPSGERVPEILSKKSEILVLKLHGSVGWRSGNPGELVFENLWLNHLLPQSLEPPIVDSDERPFADTLPHALAYPSFLKRFENRFILDIWQRANQALRRAHEVQIWGYSLPASDSAVGVLLQSLRERAQYGEIIPDVYQPEWRTFRPLSAVL